MRELERFDDAVDDQRGAETGAEAEEEHSAAFVAAERLHDGVVHDLRRLPERRSKSKPIQPVPRLAGSATTLPSRTGDGMPTLADVPLPAVVAASVPSTICCGVSCGPESNLRRPLRTFEASSLTCDAADVHGENAALHRYRHIHILHQVAA